MIDVKEVRTRTREITVWSLLFTSHPVIEKRHEVVKILTRISNKGLRTIAKLASTRSSAWMKTNSRPIIQSRNKRANSREIPSRDPIIASPISRYPLHPLSAADDEARDNRRPDVRQTGGAIQPPPSSDVNSACFSIRSRRLGNSVIYARIRA